MITFCSIVHISKQAIYQWNLFFFNETDFTCLNFQVSRYAGPSYPGILRNQQHHQSFPDLYRHSVANREISAVDISESYLTNQQKPAWIRHSQPSSAPNSTKGSRKFPLFSRKKKKQETRIEHGVETRDMDSEEDEEDTQIARFEDFDHGSIDPVYLGQLDDSQLNSVEEQEEQYDKIYQRRVNYILSNYEKPPPYPGTNKQGKVKQAISSSQLDQNTPLMKQLLKDSQLKDKQLNDKQLNDNSSMANFMQAPPHYRSGGYNQRNFQGDNLVMRTQNIPTQKSAETSRELYEKRQHYMEKINEIEHSHPSMANHQSRDRDAISEIVYPAKNYEYNQLQRPINKMHLSASVPDLSMNSTKNYDNVNFATTARKPRGNFLRIINIIMNVT